ncbi:MAG: Crp/Fnr family transcriptional regulator [Anaerolineales bacterium]|nr:Crp/Fnr family transcriptional regulator [Anaerolineales bacterium]MCB0010421.1 Crp/Fnr family transcriptional regulator [Anaerolineales bacterium]MCB0019702.1 Crp/Fnr family transcriptional regulator [Anaerolineales bacterium]MCB8961940.1 Crp/Fnr family transcriptional regulator [Ardenticatenales bacterium]
MNTSELSFTPPNETNNQANRPGRCATQQLSNFLSETTLFANLDAATISEVAAALVRRRYQARETIFYQGDPGTVLYMIYSGQVRIFVSGLDGAETSLVLLGQPGEIFGDFAVIDGLPRSASAVAMLDTVVFTLSREAFQRIVLRAPQVAINFMATLSQRLRYSTSQLDSLATLDISTRLAGKLLELAGSYGAPVQDGHRINMSINQSEIASLIGATRESTNKLLRVFRRQGILRLKGGQIIILDMAALRRAAQG